jgi:hypothetical protein
LARPLFPQNVIAVVWDFDKTLCPTYMQVPLFRRYGVDEGAFWREVNDLPDTLGRPDDQQSEGALRVNRDTVYLNRILDYVRAGIFPGLTNALLRELGRELEFYLGIPEVLIELKDLVRADTKFAKFEIEVEHYVVSTGLREMIVGSTVYPYLDGVWGCEFAEASPSPAAPESDAQLPLPAGGFEVAQIAYAIDNTSKTRAIFEINKGSNKHPDRIDVNSAMRAEDRRVPIENMIYIADGPSDTPSFSVVGGQGGRALAVYAPGDRAAFAQAYDLQQQGRVHGIAPADYTTGAQARMWLEATIQKMADRILSSRERELAEQVGSPARHIVPKPRISPKRTPALRVAVPAPNPAGDVKPVAPPHSGRVEVTAEGVRARLANEDRPTPASTPSTKLGDAATDKA